jgi:hypothetical protein
MCSISPAPALKLAILSFAPRVLPTTSELLSYTKLALARFCVRDARDPIGTPIGNAAARQAFDSGNTSHRMTEPHGSLMSLFVDRD